MYIFVKYLARKKNRNYIVNKNKGDLKPNQTARNWKHPK
jgi:hypothetical protein